MDGGLSRLLAFPLLTFNYNPATTCTRFQEHPSSWPICTLDQTAPAPRRSRGGGGRHPHGDEGRLAAAAARLPRAGDPRRTSSKSWFAKGWICVGREEDIALPGQYFLTKLCDENLIVVRDNDRTVRAFFNFCRHRGATLVTGSRAGRIPRFQCPYHAWVYDLDGKLHTAAPHRHARGLQPRRVGPRPGRRSPRWQGFIFINVSNDAAAAARGAGRHAGLLRALRPGRSAPGAR